MGNSIRKRSALAVLAVMAMAAGTAQGQTAAPAPRAAAPAAQPAQAAPFSTVPQVCQIREREIAAVNSQLLLRNQALARESDAAKRAQLSAPIPQLRSDLRETEASWQRMDCARLLYAR